VPERYAEDVTVGASAIVSFDVLSGESFSVPVRYVGATVNPENRTFQVELTVPNPQRIVKPEMVANIEIVRRNLDAAIVIPQEAVVRVEAGFVAFVVEDGPAGPVAAVRSLVLGTGQRNEVVVEEGLSAGDRLIVVGQTQVADGDQVRIVGTRPGGVTEAER
jgi:multidrug efflux pump subunit AcrA (membrane-fusion protein)